MISTKCLALGAILLINITFAHGYGSGAPNSKKICSTLIPGHGSKQEAASPYKLIVTDSNGQVKVNLVATSQVTFAGFIVQARLASDLDTIVDGSFEMSENTQAKDCANGKQVRPYIYFV